MAETKYSEYFALAYDTEGNISIALSEYGMKLPSGTYVVSYQILIADADNAKPITWKAKVTVR